MLRTALLALTLVALPALSVAQSQPAEQHAPAPQESAAQPEPGHVAAGEAGGEHGPTEAAAHAEGQAHAETIWGPISRAFNSAVLFGVLYYFLRKPMAAYLGSRGREIRNDLVTAAEMKQTATAQLAALEQKLAALPGELAALKVRGQEEIAAEEARIEEAAAAERTRLLEQTRREIDLQLRIAQRELVEHASNLAVGLAGDRIRANITPDDQSRLVDRYLQQVKS
jgi:F-type H+-transporting ATPase subunit b